MEKRTIDEIKKEISLLKKNQQDVIDRLSKLEWELSKYSIDVEPIHTESAKPHAIPTVLETKNSSDLRHDDLTSDSTIYTLDPVSNSELEFKIGGTWLNRIGIVAVILGLSYFLKYSIENEWIGPTGRVLMGIFTGLAMLVTGEKLRKKYHGYAQGLLGGGSLALFFSVYVSYSFYNLISSTYAFLFMILVMVLTVFMAILHHSLPIGLLGIIGGYVIPYMVGDSNASVWAYYSYLTLLTSGVLGVSFYKKWTVFRYLSFFFSHLAIAVWIIEDSFHSSRGEIPSLFFSFILFALYIAVASVYNIRKQIMSTNGDLSLLFLNALFFFGESCYFLTDIAGDDYLGFYAVLLALLYTYLGKMAIRLNHVDKMQIYGLFVISFILITIAIPIQLDENYIGIAWLAESIGLVVMARKIGVPKLQFGGLVVLALGGVTALNELTELFNEESFLLNYPTFMIVLIMLALFVHNKLLRENKLVTNVLRALFLCIVFLALTLQNHHYFTLYQPDFFLSIEHISLSILWLLYAISLFFVGLRLQNRYLRFSSLGLIGLVIVKAFLIDLAELETVFKILLFIGMGVCLLGISFVYQKKKDVL